MILGTFRIGEDIAIALDAVEGDPSEVASVTAFIQRSLSASPFDPDPAFPPIALTVGVRAAAGDIPAGWNLVLPAAESADLPPGVYGIDARFTGTGGSVDITDVTALVRLTQSAIGVAGG